MTSPSTVRKNLWLVADATLLGLLFYIVFNSLHANWGPDIEWGVLFARINGPIFYNAHALSMLSVSIAATYQVPWRGIIKQSGLASKAILAVFSTVSVHELQIFAIGLRQGLFLDSLNYVAYLVTFLTLAILLCNHYQKTVIGVVTVALFPYFIITNYYLPIGADVIGFDPGPDFYNPVTNAVEVASWLIPSSLWMLPRRWFSRLWDVRHSPRP